MGDPAGEAIESFHKWNDAFNSRDTETQVAHMHFPHLRLAGNRFQLWETPDDFRAGQGDLTVRLKAESWHYTETMSVKTVQSNREKVHLVIRQSRRDVNGVEYNGFDTLWIFTKIDGRWGVQFRSSFLESVASGLGSSPA